MTENRKVVIGTELDANGVRPGAEQVKGVVRDMARDVKAAGADAAKSIGGIGDSAKGAGEKVDRETRSIINSIQRANAEAQAGKRGTAEYYEAIAKLRGVGTDSLKPYLDQLRQTEAAQKAAAVAQKATVTTLDQVGVSAKQTAAALRGVPAQFIDIVTALQGGQAPLTVFLQQGGQLSDMFGSTGAAAKALGGYIVGLINPFTVAAAAIVGLAVAYEKGASESAAFNRALILTGNAAGVTAGQLSDMAAAVNAVGAGSRGRAAEVLNEFVKLGSVGAGSMERFTAAALQLEKVGGGAAEETAKAFGELGRTPTEASRKLNETTNFLTTSIYAQIQALEQQGRAVEAARVAQDAYASVIEQRTPAIAQNLGIIERAWLAVKEATKGAIDAAAGIGRKDTLGDQLRANEEQIARLKAVIGNRAIATPKEFFSDLVGKESFEAQLQAAQRMQGYLQEQIRLEQRVADTKAAAADQTRAATKWLDEQGKYLSRNEQMEREIARVQNEGLAAGKSQVEIEQRIARIRQQFDPGVNLQQIKNIEAERLEIVKRSEVEIQAQRATGVINERQAIEELSKLEVKQIDIRMDAVSAELGLARQRVNAEREVAALQGQLAQLAAARVTAELKGTSDLAAVDERRKRASEGVLQAQREEEAAARTAYLIEQARARNNISAALHQQERALAEQNEQLKLEAGLIGQSNAVRNLRLEQFRIELDLRRRLEQIDRTDYPDGEEGRERDRQRARENAAKASAQAAARASFDEWRQRADDIAGVLSDAILNGGEDGGKRLRDYFKRLVLEPVIKIAVQPLANALSSVVSQIVGGVGSQAGAGGGITQAIFNNAGLLGKIGGSIVGLFGNTVGASSGSLLWANGVGAAGGDSLGALISANGAWGGVSAGAGAAGGGGGSSLAGFWPLAVIAGMLMSNSAYKQGFSDEQLSHSNIFTSSTKLTTQVLKAFGVSDRVANILSGAPLMARLLGPKWSQGGWATGGVSDGAFVPSDQMRINFGDNTEKVHSSDLDKVLKGLTLNIAEAAKNFGGTIANNIQLGAFTDLDRKGLVAAKVGFFGPGGGDPIAGVSTGVGGFIPGMAGAQKINAGDLSKFLDEQMPALIVQGLQASDLPARFKDYFGTLGKDLITTDTAKHMLEVAQGVQQMTDAFTALGGVFAQLPDITVAAGEEILKLFGGIDGFTQSAGQYFQDYYSEAERTAVITSQVTDKLSKLGYALPATREAFRALVDAQDLTTEAGRKTYASLLQLSPAFASIVEATQSLSENSAAAAEQMAEAGRRVLKGLSEKSTALQIDLLEAQGDKVAAAAKRREADLATLLDGLSEADKTAATAAYDYTIALQDQVEAQRAAKAAADQAAQAAALQRTNLENQLLLLQGDTAAIRQRELAALDPANRALQEQVYALQDQQAAAARAAEATNALTNTLDGLQSTRFDLENQLLAAQGKSSEVARRTRERDLQQLTAGLSATDAARVAELYDYNVALRDQIAAQEAAAEAQQEAARVADQARQAWQSLTDSIVDEVSRIRALMLSTSSPTSLAGAQAQFAVATAQARAGDQRAAEMLPELSQTLLTLAEAQATSLLELQRIRAQTAASLTATTSSIASQQGVQIPKFAVGTDYVPADMLAMIHEGEAVVPKAYNPSAAGNAWARMADSLDGVRADSRAQAMALVKVQQQIAKVLERWESDGLPETRVTA